MSSLKSIGIDKVFWPDNGNEVGAAIYSSDEIKLRLLTIWEKDHCEYWIVESHLIDGKFEEVAYQNPRYVQTIIF